MSDFEFDDFSEKEDEKPVVNPYKNLNEMADDLNTQNRETILKIKAEAEDYRKRFKFQNDGKYYFSIVFKSKEDRDQFLKDKGIELDFNNGIFYDNIQEVFK